MGTVLDRPVFARQGPAIVIYGPPGFGKTSLVSGLAKKMAEAGAGPVLHADWELSTESLVPLNEHLPAGALRVWVPDLMKSPVDEGLDMVDSALRMNASALVVDTIGAFAAHQLEWLATQNYGSKGKSTLRPGVRTPRGFSVTSPTQQDYGMVANAFMSWMKYALRLRSKGVPIVLLGHERLLSAEDESGTTIDAFGGPEFVGRKLTREFDKLAQVIVHGKFVRRPGKPPQRILFGEPDGIWAGKDRLHLWPRGGFDFTADGPEDIVERAAKFWEPVIERLQEKGFGTEEKQEEKPVVRRRRRKQA